MQELLPSDMEALTLKSGLQLHPEKLRAALQAMIDDITANTEPTILGYELGSMRVFGLKETGSVIIT